MQLYDKTFFHPSLPFMFSCLCVSCVVFSFCDDHQFINVSRCENSWWLQRRRRCCSLVGHGLVLGRYWTHVEEPLLYCNLLLMNKLLVICQIFLCWVKGTLGYLDFLHWILRWLRNLYTLSLALEMANKPVPVGITRTRPRFDGESPLWLGMGMGMGNTRNFQLGMGMGIYIYPPKYPSPLKLLNYL